MNPLLIIIHGGSLIIFHLLFGGVKFVIKTYGQSRKCSKVGVNEIVGSLLPHGTSIVNASHSSVQLTVFETLYDIQFPTAISHKDLCRCICSAKSIKTTANSEKVVCLNLISRLLSADAIPFTSSITEERFDKGDGLEKSSPISEQQLSSPQKSADADLVEIKLVINDLEFTFSFDLALFSEDDVATAFCQEKGGALGLSPDQLSLCVPPIAAALRKEIAAVREEFGGNSGPDDSQLVATDAMLRASVPEATSSTSKAIPKLPADDPPATSTTGAGIQIVKNINGLDYVFDFYRNSSTVSFLARQFCQQERTTLQLTETSQLTQCFAVIEQMLREELAGRLSDSEMTGTVDADSSAALSLNSVDTLQPP